MLVLNKAHLKEFLSIKALSILLTFLNSFSIYFQAEILLFELLTNNVSYSGINSVVNIVNFLLKTFFVKSVSSVPFVK